MITWEPPDVDDAALARLPWDGSRRAFSTTGPVSSTRRSATAGWHGKSTDPERGANCIVRSDGPLAELVGERLKVTYRRGTLERAVYLYCHDEADFPAEAAVEDLSLTRRAFMALGPLASDTLPVIVEVLS